MLHPVPSPALPLGDDPSAYLVPLTYAALSSLLALLHLFLALALALLLPMPATWRSPTRLYLLSLQSHLRQVQSSMSFYRWESRQRWFRQATRQAFWDPWPLLHCEAYANTALFALGLAPVIVVATSWPGLAWTTNGTMHLSSRAQNPVAILHEVAHLSCPPRPTRPLHSPQFAAAYFSLLQTYLSIPADSLATSARQAGLPVTLPLA